MVMQSPKRTGFVLREPPKPSPRFRFVPSTRETEQPNHWHASETSSLSLQCKLSI